MGCGGSKFSDYDGSEELQSPKQPPSLQDDDWKWGGVGELNAQVPTLSPLTPSERKASNPSHKVAAWAPNEQHEQQPTLQDNIVSARQRGRGPRSGIAEASIGRSKAPDLKTIAENKSYGTKRVKRATAPAVAAEAREQLDGEASRAGRVTPL